MLGTLKCGQPHYSKAKPLNIVKKDAEETYYFIGKFQSIIFTQTSFVSYKVKL